MLSKEIRRKFIEYFKNNGHTHVPSSPSFPYDDPTLLFTNAGMNQFKDVFLGKATREYTKATTSQKCIRVGGKHNDLDNVGHTARHITFFEMLGNFSFGDYFKKEAIQYAFDVTMNVFEFPIEKLWISVYEKDDEAYELWKKHVDEKRIVRIGAKDNFWAMGDVGPCGPCSELFIDRGEKYGNATSPKNDETGERFIEFWNLVFMENNRAGNQKLMPLQKKSIDTGAGLERILSLKTDVPTVFETDILRSIITDIEKCSRKTYERGSKNAPAFHVVADHLRSLSFAIADGAEPGNIERGYVLRKIIRRAMRYSKTLGLQKPFLSSLVPGLIHQMGDDFPELSVAKDRICTLLHEEEESFLRTLKRGGNLLQKVVDKAESSNLKQISGEDAFKLKDTYGLPIDEILLLAKDSNLQVNLDAFELLEQKAKETSKQGKKETSQTFEDSFFDEFLEKHGASKFIGYDRLSDDATIVGIIKKGNFVETLQEGEEGILLLDQTPFYAEMGGQLGDMGTISHNKANFTVIDTKSPFTGITAHIGKLESGTLIVSEPVLARVEKTRRDALEKHHSATHLLHFALTSILGDQIKQAGSLVEENKLRFDFHYHESLSKEKLREIEMLINAKIRDASPVSTKEISIEEARGQKEIKQFFGDKYGNFVRVVDIGGFAKELCGGTHVTNVSTIGLFKIAKESSIAKGVRRIEAVIGPLAENLIYECEDTLLKIADTIKSPLSKVEETLTSLIQEKKQLQEEYKKLKKEKLLSLSTELLSKKKTISHIPTLFISEQMDAKDLIPFAESLFKNMGSGILAVFVPGEDKCQALIKVSQEYISKGIHANDLIKVISTHIKGGGGGNKESAQAGGKNPDGITLAIETLEKHIESLC